MQYPFRIISPVAMTLVKEGHYEQEQKPQTEDLARFSYGRHVVE